MRENDAFDYWHGQGPDYFRELSTFGALPDEAVLRMLQKGRVISLEAGERLYAKGESSEAFYIVLSGRMNSWMPRRDGGWTLARCHEPGDDMGFVPMIALVDRPANTQAEVNTVVLEISCGQFLDLQQKEPDVFGLMLLNLARGMARTVITMVSIMAERDSQLHKVYAKAPKPAEGDTRV